MFKSFISCVSIIIARFRKPVKKVKEVVNVKYPVYKKAS